MQTITDIATIREISPTSARVAVRRAYEKLGEAMPKETTNETPLPEYILALIQNKGAKIGKVNGSAVKPAQGLESDRITPEQEKIELERILLNGLSIDEYQKALQDGTIPIPTTSPQSDIKPNVAPEVVPEAPKIEEVKPVIAATIEDDILDTVLGKKILVLAALGICIAVDGYCSGIVAEREIETPGAFNAFGVLGIVFGFAAIYNAYRLSLKVYGYWDKNYTGYWIFGFSAFQYLLHGSAFELFSDWSYLTMQQIISRNLLCIITPFATAALSVTLFKQKKIALKDESKVS